MWCFPATADTVSLVKRTLTLDIAGARYKLSTDADEAHLLSLATMVNERIDALGSKAARSASPAQLLAVVALGLAEEVKEAEAQRDALENLTLTTISRALDRIDRRLSEDAELARRDAGERGGSGDRPVSEFPPAPDDQVPGVVTSD